MADRPNLCFKVDIARTFDVVKNQHPLLMRCWGDSMTLRRISVFSAANGVTADEADRRIVVIRPIRNRALTATRGTTAEN